MASTVNRQTSISLPARLLCAVGPPSAILLTSLASPRAGLLTPLAFIPTSLSYFLWRKSHKSDPDAPTKLETLIWTFVGVGTIGLTAVVVTQIAMLAGVARVLFPDAAVRKAFMTEFARTTVDGLTSEELAGRTAMASTWRNWALDLSLSFGMAALTEEVLKVSPILFFAKKDSKREVQSNVEGNKEENTTKPDLQHAAYLDLALTAGLSFSLFEGIGFLYSACEGAQETGWTLVRTICERFIAGSTAHLLYAALTGLRATRKLAHGDSLSWWAVVAPSILLHGTGNALAFSLSTLDGNVGWIHPKGLWTNVGLYTAFLSVNGFAAWLVRREWNDLKWREAKNEKKM